MRLLYCEYCRRPCFSVVMRLFNVLDQAAANTLQ